MNDDEEGHDDNEAPASETVEPQEHNDWVHVLNKTRTVKGESKKIWNRWTRPTVKEGRWQPLDHS